MTHPFLGDKPVEKIGFGYPPARFDIARFSRMQAATNSLAK
jgi:hypothetical protein